MAEASRLNIGVSAGGEQAHKGIKKRSQIPMRTPMLEEVVQWIHSLGLDQEIEKQLIKKAQKYPLDAMYRFRDKLHHHIAEIQKNLAQGNYPNIDESKNQ